MITRRDLVMVALAAFLFGGTAGLLGGMVGARILTNVGMRVSGEMRPPGAPFWRIMRRPSNDGPPGPPPVLGRLANVLDLTPAQRESISVVLERSRGRFDALRDSLDAQIEARLTEAQREQWRMMHEHGPPRREDWPRHPSPHRLANPREGGNFP
ncbi:MAG: hypothetical protein ACRENS_01625 [Candidatus Eiseniibacteriota bacterium]